MRGLDWRGTLSRGELGVISEGARLDGGSEWGSAEVTGKEARACDDLGVEVKKGAIKEAIRVIIQLYQYL